jgi:hypothetical protein
MSYRSPKQRSGRTDSPETSDVLIEKQTAGVCNHFLTIGDKYVINVYQDV